MLVVDNDIYALISLNYDTRSDVFFWLLVV
jgi:hypothetical protein